MARRVVQHDDLGLVRRQFRQQLVVHILMDRGKARLMDWDGDAWADGAEEVDSLTELHPRAAGWEQQGVDIERWRLQGITRVKERSADEVAIVVTAGQVWVDACMIATGHGYLDTSQPEDVSRSGHAPRRGDAGKCGLGARAVNQIRVGVAFEKRPESVAVDMVGVGVSDQYQIDVEQILEVTRIRPRIDQNLYGLVPKRNFDEYTSVPEVGDLHSVFLSLNRDTYRELLVAVVLPLRAAAGGACVVPGYVSCIGNPGTVAIRPYLRTEDAGAGTVGTSAPAGAPGT